MKEINNFDFNDVLKLSRDYFKLFIDPIFGLNLSMNDYLKTNNFSNKAINYIDRNCRLIDGGDSTRISFNTYFNIINECVL